MPQLTLYRANGSCSLVPHMLLNELEIPFKEVLLKFAADGATSADGSFTHEDYLKIHPLGYVPALKIDDQVLTENPAIQTYIATNAPEKKLLGDSPIERARVAEWLAYVSSTLHGYGIAMSVIPNRFTDNEEHHEMIKKKGQKKLLDCFEEVNRRLGDREFAVGSHETVADYYLFYFYLLARSPFFGIKMAHLESYTRLAKRMAQKTSVKAAMEKEGLSLAFE